jgi:hypothetical protein
MVRNKKMKTSFIHNLKTNFDKILEIVKQLSKEYSADFLNLISPRQYNQRRKLLFNLTDTIRTNIATTIDGGESHFCVDSKALPVCKFSRARCCKLGKDKYDQAPSFGYCATQKMHYYEYKLHSVCGLSGVIHSFNLTKASVHDIHYLQEVKYELFNCTLIGDRGNLSTAIQLDLFETARIELSVPYRANQKNYHPVFKPFARARKRIEIVFSQLDDQFMLVRNYAKQQAGLFVRVLAKISAMTVLQYFNKIKNAPIGRVKYALI